MVFPQNILSPETYTSGLPKILKCHINFFVSWLTTVLTVDNLEKCYQDTRNYEKILNLAHYGTLKTFTCEKILPFSAWPHSYLQDVADQHPPSPSPFVRDDIF